MLEVACAGETAFEVSRIEEGTARNYSILTIEKLLAGGSGPLSFLIGADAFAEIHTWHRWQEVVAAVDFIVVPRPGASWEVPPGAVAHELDGVELPVSSSEIRSRLAAGDCNVPVPTAVLDYIRQHGLYRSRPA
jgi:nicotinate-nucleotide adenylyltransferase